MNINMLDAFKEVVMAIKKWSDDDKVQKVDGKGLSTNDYTDEEKDKVATMPNDLVILNGELFLAHNGSIVKNSAVTLPSGGSGTSSSVLNTSTVIDIPLDNWFEITPNALYAQYINIDLATENTKVELNPTAEQIMSLQVSETILTVENKGTGLFKVWAIGGKPLVNYSIRVSLTEVAKV